MADNNINHNERANDMNNENNQYLIILILLGFIRILAGSFVTTITATIVLVVQIVKITNRNSVESVSRTNNLSSSEQDMNWFDRTTNEKSSSLNTNTAEDLDLGTPLGEENNNTDDLITENQHTDRSTEDEIDRTIINNQTAAILFTPSHDNGPQVSENVGTAETTETSNSTTRSNRTSASESSDETSAFVTENVMPIAVSYSSQKRNLVFKITKVLKHKMLSSRGPNVVFFDQDFQHEICRINGQSHLHNIYRQAQLVVVFLSSKYTDSRYCTGEWRTIFQRFISTKDNPESAQLLLVKLGDYDMKKLDLTDADFSVNGLRMSNEEIADIVVKRWEIIQKELGKK